MVVRGGGVREEEEVRITGIVYEKKNKGEKEKSGKGQIFIEERKRRNVETSCSLGGCRIIFVVIAVFGSL